MSLTLNDDQQTVSDEFFKFLLSDKQSMIISGGAGYGKSTLLGHLVHQVLPQYFSSCTALNIPPKFTQMFMTATTNPAAHQLTMNIGMQAQTIHKLLGLVLMTDYQTGDQYLKRTRKSETIYNAIIFIDEGYAMSHELYKFIHECTKDCKLIFVGDIDQLLAPKESSSVLDGKSIPIHELTIPMRNGDIPELVDLCNQFKETVRTGVFEPIETHAGIVDHYSYDEIEDVVQQLFVDCPDTEPRLFAYTNNMVIDTNTFLRHLRNQTTQYSVGEVLRCNNAIKAADGSTAIGTDQEVVINSITGKHYELDLGIDEDTTLDVYDAIVTNTIGQVLNIKIPVDMYQYRDLLKYTARIKNWRAHYMLKETIPDLRMCDASTVHKAQGASHDVVFVDLGDISTCRNPNTVARLLYVACSRARKRVILFGDLPSKFGGIL